MYEFYNAPLLLEHQYAQQAISEAQRQRESLSTILFPVSTQAPDRDLFADSIAIIRVMGSLWHRGWRSYEWVAQDFRAALENPAVKGIVFDLDSPGGVVHGAFDLADLIYANRDAKPSLAIVNERATSGAYAIASSSGRVVVPRTADVGSVGVVTMHVDMSKWLDRIGDNVTLIFAGDRKVDGNPYEPLPDAVRGRIQADINQVYELFVSTVARNRSMQASAVSATQAAIYRGEEAVDVGFADGVMSAADALLEFVDQVNQTGVSVMKIKVSDLKKQLKDQGIEDERIAKLELPTDDNAEVDVDTDEGRLSGDEDKSTDKENRDGKTAKLTPEKERERISTILNSEYAKGREKLAKHFAFETTMSADDAIAALKASEKGVTDPLTEAMQQIQQPDLGGGDDQLQEPTVEQSWDHAFQRVGAKMKGGAA